MKTVEISFEELRKHYSKTCKFIEDISGVKKHQIGIYSTFENDLYMCDEDIEDMMFLFLKEFEIQPKSDIKPISKWSQNILLYIFSLLTILLICFFIYHWQITLIIAIIITILIFIENRNYIKPQIIVPTKKEWNPDKLSVADLVCMVVEKKNIYKKDIHFVIKKLITT